MPPALPNNHETPAASAADILALHAGALRAMTAFVRQPSAAGAETVTRLLAALGRHPQRFVAPCGHDVYAHAHGMWEHLATHMRERADGRHLRALH